jgi:hypothetical protein
MEMTDENAQLINIYQAMLGALTPNFRAVSFECAGDRVHVWFLLEVESQLDCQEIEDIVFELEALQLSAVKISFEIIISREVFSDLWGVKLSGRMAFKRNEERRAITDERCREHGGVRHP